MNNAHAWTHLLQYITLFSDGMLLLQQLLLLLLLLLLLCAIGGIELLRQRIGLRICGLKFGV